MSDEESLPMSGQGAASTKQSWANRLPPSLMQSKGGSPIKTPTGSPSKSPAKSPGSSSSDTSPAKVCVHDTCCSNTSPAKVCEHGIQWFTVHVTSYSDTSSTKVSGHDICNSCHFFYTSSTKVCGRDTPDRYQFLLWHHFHQGSWMWNMWYITSYSISWHLWYMWLLSLTLGPWRFVDVWFVVHVSSYTGTRPTEVCGYVIPPCWTKVTRSPANKAGSQFWTQHSLIIHSLIFDKQVSSGNQPWCAKGDQPWCTKEITRSIH